MTTPDPARLARIARGRRDELGLTQAQAADLAGVSDQTWLTLENGRNVSRRTLAGADKALRWQPGSARAVLLGGDPTPEGATREDDINRLLATIEERLGISAPTDGPTDERLEDILDEIDRNLGLGRDADGGGNPGTGGNPNSDGDGARGHSKGAPSY